MEQILKWSMIALAVVVIGVLTYGFVKENIVKARESVATVGSTPIATAEFQSRVRFTRLQLNNELGYLFQQQQALDPTNPDVQFYLEYIQGNIRDLQSQLAPENALILGEEALEQLIQEELVRQEAARRGITVSSEELDTEIEQFFGYDRNPVMPTIALSTTLPVTPTDALEPEPTPTQMTEQDFRQRYDNFIKNMRDINVTEKLYRSWVEVTLLQEKLQEQLVEETPTTADQVKLRYISVDDEQRASEVAARWDAGEDYEVLLSEVQEDEEIRAYGSEVDWLPRDALERRFDADLAEMIFSMPVGERSAPILSQDTNEYTIIEMLGHEERELDLYYRQQMATEAFQEWLEAQQVLVQRGTYRDRVPTDP